MPVRLSCIGNTPVTIGDNESTALEFTQNLALTKSLQGDLRSFFVADLGKIRSLVVQWNTYLPRVRPYYSVICNSNDILLRILSTIPQIGLHCMTKHNLEVALEYVMPERLFYTNPCWTKQTLRQANNVDVGLLSFDSKSNLDRMAAERIKSNLILNVALQSTSVNSELSSVIGCSSEQAPELLAYAADLGLNVVGIGFNASSSGYRESLFENAIELAANLFAIGESLGFQMQVLNLGDSFPPIITPNSSTFESICFQVNNSLEYFFPQRHCKNLNIIATPGRFFAASIFSLVTSIVKKMECDASLITNDDFDVGQKGYVYHINEGYYGPFNCRTVANCDPKCVPLFKKTFNNGSDKTDDNNINEENLFYGSVLGPNVDDEFDTVQPQCRFRNLSVGDWLFWENLGAYSMDNCDSLGEEGLENPSVYFFAKETDWKFISPDTILGGVSDDQQCTCLEEYQQLSDGDSAIDSESEDSLWIFDLYEE